MANRPQAYGLSRELALKTAGKYSDADEVSFKKKSEFGLGLGYVQFGV